MVGLWCNFFLKLAIENTPGDGPACSIIFLLAYTSYIEAIISLTESLFITLILGSLGRALESVNWLNETPAEEKPVRCGLISIDWVTFGLFLPV